MTKKILVITEGARQEYRFVQRLKDVYLPEDDLDVVSYNNNVYDLYKKLSDDCEDDFSELDFINVLLSNERDVEKKQLLSQKFTDILLIFDFDPQSDSFDFAKLKKLMEFFAESTDQGRLYVNYPMFESFFHLSNIKSAIVDENFRLRTYNKEQLDAKLYKTLARSRQEGCSIDIELMSKRQLDCVIEQQLCKANYILSGCYTRDFDLCQHNMLDILQKEYKMLSELGFAPVLNTCAFYIAEEYPCLIGASVCD